MITLFGLFYGMESDKEVIIKNECENELYCGKFGNVSMKYEYFKVYKVIEEDDIMIIYI